MIELIIPGNNYSEDAHLQTPWWRGWNDANEGREYHNGYATVTARYEYQQGFLTGSSR